MSITTPKELFVAMLSDVHHGAERTAKIYEELGQLAQHPEIKEALDARDFISKQITSRLDECFRIIGEKPVKTAGRLHEAFVEDFRKELAEIQGPVAKRIFVLAKANRLAHIRMAEYSALIAAADLTGHYAVGVLLESCLADKTVFAERTRHLIRRQLEQKIAGA
jgi:ferritin-like metal-binding protein YciE